MRDLFPSNLIHVSAVSVGIVLLVAVLAVLERATSRFTAHRLGWRAILFTAWIGVPIHELSHLAAALLFGHRIVAWSLFSPNPASGTLGYVKHAHAARSLRQTAGYFFIAVAPTIVGLSLIVLLLWWMTSGTDVFQMLSNIAHSWRAEARAHAVNATADHVVALVSQIWQHRSPWLAAQVYLAICIACHMAPSAADFRNAGRGLLATLVLIGVSTSVVSLLGVSLDRVWLCLPVGAALVALVALYQLLHVLVVGAVSRII